MTIVRSFLDQLTPMEAKTYIYVAQCHFGVKLFFLVPNLKQGVKIPDFEVREFLAFTTSTALDRTVEIFLPETFLDVFPT